MRSNDDIPNNPETTLKGSRLPPLITCYGLGKVVSHAGHWPLSFVFGSLAFPLIQATIEFTA